MDEQEIRILRDVRGGYVVVANGWTHHAADLMALGPLVTRVAAQMSPPPR